MCTKLASSPIKLKPAIVGRGMGGKALSRRGTAGFYSLMGCVAALFNCQKHMSAYLEHTHTQHKTNVLRNVSSGLEHARVPCRVHA